MSADLNASTSAAPNSDPTPVPSPDRLSLTLPEANRYQAGRLAFERGRYREAIAELEAARALAVSATDLGGEIQIWLVTAYEAAGLTEAAEALCAQVARHPVLRIRKQAQRLLVILRAPRLRHPPEWMTEIPDLGAIDQAKSLNFSSGSGRSSAPRRPPEPAPPPDPAAIARSEQQAEQFLWWAGAVVLALGAAWAWLA